MSVILKGMKNGKFVGGVRGWTKNAPEARVFAGPTQALFYCAQHEVWNVEMRADDFFIPLAEFGRDKAKRLAAKD